MPQNEESKFKREVRTLITSDPPEMRKCVTCSKDFEVAGGRGRPPLRCPACQKAIKLERWRKYSKNRYDTDPAYRSSRIQSATNARNRRTKATA